AITIRSHSGNPDRSTIDCEGTSSQWHQGIIVHGAAESSTLISGITITGAWYDIGGNGGAIEIRDSSPTVENCTLRENACGEGAVIGADHSASRIRNCMFVSNHSLQDIFPYSGAVDASQAPLQTEGCTFVGNTTVRGASAIAAVHGESTLRINACI